MSTGRGLPYEYDVAVLTPFALYHVEVKGYHGVIRGNAMQWYFENGGSYPSPIPLANKKSKILASKLRQHSHWLEHVFVETLVLLTEDRARAKLTDDQAGRVVHLKDAVERLTDASTLPVSTKNVSALADTVCEALSTTRPTKKIQRIGLYDIKSKMDQDDRFTVFLAKHRFIQTQPLTVLKVYHLDVYTTHEEKEYRIREIFHSHDAMRLLGAHPNLVRCGDMFAWNDDSFVEPVGYAEGGQLLEWLLDKQSERLLTWEEKTRIIKGVAVGLAHAHKHGVIHRDVRPRNIVVAAGGVVKLGNFDLAFIPNAPSIARSVLDRVDHRYIAPCVLEDPSDVSAASDIYSLGLVFYQLITGQPPRHDAEAVLAGKGHAIDAELLVTALSQSDSPNFMADPTGAAEVIGRMCAPKRSDRYATLADALEDLAICEA